MYTGIALVLLGTGIIAFTVGDNVGPPPLNIAGTILLAAGLYFFGCGIWKELRLRMRIRRANKEWKEENKDLETQILNHCKKAVDLPEDYFSRWSPDHFNVLLPVPVDGGSGLASPLHDIMEGGHSGVPERVKTALWDNPEYRRVVSWVLRNQSPEDVEKIIPRMKSHGYWEPMGTVLETALARNLVGVVFYFSVETGRREPQYYLPRKGQK